MLTALGEREYVRRIGRRPGQKEDRFEHLLGPHTDGEVVAVASTPVQVEPHPSAPAPVELQPSAPRPVEPRPSVLAPPTTQPPAPPPVDVDGALAERIEALESEVASLRAELDELRDLLTAPAAD